MPHLTHHVLRCADLAHGLHHLSHPSSPLSRVSLQDVELEIQVLPGSMDKAWIPNFLEDKLKGALTFSVRWDGCCGWLMLVGGREASLAGCLLGGSCRGCCGLHTQVVTLSEGTLPWGGLKSGSRLGS